MTKNPAKAKDPVVTKYFAGYWSMLNAERPVQAKEARQLYEYFDACQQQGITVDTDYIRELVGFTKALLEADFSETGSFWDKVKMSYTRWYQPQIQKVMLNMDLKALQQNGDVVVLS